MLLWIHPLVQGLTALLALYVLWLGWQRFSSRHLGRQTVFQWNRHVTLGKVVVIVWALGAFGGIGATYISFGKIFPQSTHFIAGLLTLPVLLLVWLTGTHMDRNRGKSNTLPLVHLVAVLVMLVLVGIQAVTGIGIVQNVLLK
ncbi:MAG: DUF4079 domain-containing protein [Desulfobacterales bacterium]|nr:DUF4079 domain-containing protein [Desulfobacterales bacterium]MCF8079187.1 DUF4079 domain-containing protein [Desulfobacterales bacterium]